MNKIILILSILIICICLGCSSSSSHSEKYQDQRDNIMNVQSKIKEINIEEVLIGAVARLYLVGDYLLIADHKSSDKLIRIFNKSDFKYITSIGNLGQGPDEITIMGHIEEDKINSLFYVSDHGKQKIFSYNLDSVLVNPEYVYQKKMSMRKKQFPTTYQYINDTLAIGLIIEPIGNNGFKQTVARWNMKTGDIKPISNKHPKVDKKRVSFAASMKDNLFVECYSYYDLMTIYDFNGNVKCNVYGPNWNNDLQKSVSHYRKVIFCKNKILVSYRGEMESENSHLPSKFFIFDMNGDYIKTIETGYEISDYCYDEINDRILMSLNDDIQFAYLSLDNIF